MSKMTMEADLWFSKLNQIQELEKTIEGYRRTQSDMQEQLDDAERALSDLANEFVYKGNTVSYIYDKYHNYSKIIGQLHKKIYELEHPVNA